jgi:NAD(P)-dependent dehydrogenase (short-subunit alcohol dehydrogenase family)
MGRLTNKVAIVTGAAQGIGKGIATVFGREGAIVALWDVADKVNETAEALQESEAKAFPYKVDVADPVQVDQTARDIADEFGHVDILVNNAGIAIFSPFADMSTSDRDKVFSVNLNGVWNCTKAVIPGMLEQRQGRIVNVSSVTGPRVAIHGLTAYAATKGAISAFTRALALEVAEHGIRVNAILPGFIDTELSKPLADDLQMSEKEMSSRLDADIPMKRRGTIEEVGDLALFLASDKSSYITGQEIIIDGGNIMQEVKGAKP